MKNSNLIFTLFVVGTARSLKVATAKGKGHHLKNAKICTQLRKFVSVWYHDYFGTEVKTVFFFYFAYFAFISNNEPRHMHAVPAFINRFTFEHC